MKNKAIILFLFMLVPFSCRKNVDNPFYQTEHTLEDSKEDGSILELMESTGKKIKYIFVHCTATPDGVDYTPEMAQRDWNRRGFGGVPGYHYMIGIDGYVHILQPLNGNKTIDPGELVYGVRGYNSVSVHVAYVGGVIKYKGEFIPTDTRTEAQLRSMIELLDYLSIKYSDAQVVGHRHFNSGKACPSFDVGSWAEFELLHNETN